MKSKLITWSTCTCAIFHDFAKQEQVNQGTIAQPFMQLTIIELCMLIVLCSVRNLSRTNMNYMVPSL